jgi:hypothetical protein
MRSDLEAACRDGGGCGTVVEEPSGELVVLAPTRRRPPLTRRSAVGAALDHLEGLEDSRIAWPRR